MPLFLCLKVTRDSLLIHVFAYSLFIGLCSVTSNMTGFSHSYHSMKLIHCGAPQIDVLSDKMVLSVVTHSLEFNALPVFVGQLESCSLSSRHYGSYNKVLPSTLDRFSTSIEAIKATFTRDRICSDLFGIRSTLVRIHSVYTGAVLNWDGMLPHRITFISGPIWYQIAGPIGTESTRSRVTTRLICTNFAPVPNGSGPVQTLPKSL